MLKAQQSPNYQPVPRLLKKIREQAGLTQRELGGRIGRPQSWVYNCETSNRRVDISEFTLWVVHCGADPQESYAELLKVLKIKIRGPRKRERSKASTSRVRVAKKKARRG